MYDDCWMTSAHYQAIQCCKDESEEYAKSGCEKGGIGGKFGGIVALAIATAQTADNLTDLVLAKAKQIDDKTAAANADGEAPITQVDIAEQTALTQLAAAAAKSSTEITTTVGRALREGLQTK